MIGEIEMNENDKQSEPMVKYCCHNCFKSSGQLLLDRMILCSECGNKRCPKATNHELPCTNSNEPGQVGSVYTHPAPPVQPAGAINDRLLSVARKIRSRLICETEIENELIVELVASIAAAEAEKAKGGAA